MNAPVPTPAAVPYHHTPLFPLGPDTTSYRKLTADGVRVEGHGQDMLVVSHEALRALARLPSPTSIICCGRTTSSSCASSSTTRRPPPTTSSSRYDFLKNANISAGGVLPMCQDTGTAIVMGKKGRMIFTGGADEGALARARATLT